MKFFFFSLLLFFLFILQISVLPFLLIFGVLPNLLLVASIFFIFYPLGRGLDYRELMAFSFASGFLIDTYSGMPFGVVMLSFILTVALVHFLAYNFLEKANFFMVCIGVLIGSIAYSIISFGILRLYIAFNLIFDLGFDYSVFFKVMLIFSVLNIGAVMVMHIPFKKFVIFTDKFKR